MAESGWRSRWRRCGVSTRSYWRRCGSWIASIDVGAWCRRGWCAAVHGHEDYLLYQKTQLSLQCVNCKRETPGWDLSMQEPAA